MELLWVAMGMSGIMYSRPIAVWLAGTAMAADVGDVLLTLAFDLALSFSSVERGSLTRCVTLRHNNPMGAPNLNQQTSPPSKGECLYVKCHEVSKLSVRICAGTPCQPPFLEKRNISGMNGQLSWLSRWLLPSQWRFTTSATDGRMKEDGKRG